MDRMDMLQVSATRREAAGDTTEVVGFSKPLHRFMRVDPKSIGVVMLFLGGTQFITGIPMKRDITRNSTNIYSSFWLGILFSICGIIYIISEKRVSKKMVTASMAISIISTLGAIKAFMDYVHYMIRLLYFSLYDHYDEDSYESYNATEHMTEHVTESPTPTRNSETLWLQYHRNQVSCMEGIWLLHCFVGGVILIVMTAFSRAALRSTKTQATVIMYNRPSA
ncbi:uncharacterized protein [Paramormyrops kingsleyae]|uniref:Si:ch1073-291c23.2 n=1 Tax=Paramormyrops kingsleyae TaxID=1676925 RepID=A0A3B3SZ74_9TELE|nr:uncharacterized protein LOC111852830 isoform X2 [Paramormyrops kingsleyae]XP_023684895.1 uncharacterized protein LOC111852830 isoform X2 [Paramormyrops kingsleyae]